MQGKKVKNRSANLESMNEEAESYFQTLNPDELLTLLNEQTEALQNLINRIGAKEKGRADVTKTKTGKRKK